MILMCPYLEVLQSSPVQCSIAVESQGTGQAVIVVAMMHYDCVVLMTFSMPSIESEISQTNFVMVVVIDRPLVGTVCCIDELSL